MAAAVHNGISHSSTAHLQINFVSRPPGIRRAMTSPLSPASRARSRSDEKPILAAAVTESLASQAWQITTTVCNVSAQPQSEAIEVYAWPMFAPEESRFIASGTSTCTIPQGQSGKIEVEIQKKDLAKCNGQTGKLVLEQGIYMFEIKRADDSSAGTSVVKQVSVAATMMWDE